MTRSNCATEKAVWVVPTTVKQVTVYRYRQCFRFVPAVEGLDRLIYTRRYRFADFSGRHPEVVSIAEPLLGEEVDVLGNQFTLGFAGLEPLLKELFEGAGVEVALKGKRPPPLLEADQDSLRSLKDLDLPMLDLVRRSDRGLIRYSPRDRVRPARLIAQIVRAWPRKRIVIAVTRIHDARRLARCLRRASVKVTLYTGRDSRDPYSRVVVGTYLHLALAKLHRCEIYIALNPTEIFGGDRARDLNWAIEGVKKVRSKARMFGLMPIDAKLAPYLRDQLTALFGIEEVHVPKHGCRPVPVTAVFVPIRGGERLPCQCEEWSLKQISVHEHPIRNRRVVRLARALVSGDWEDLQQTFPQVAATLGERTPQRVAILVDVVWHGLLLAQRLNCWCAVAESTNREGLTEWACGWLVLGKEVRNRKGLLVVTPAGLEQAGRFDVIIRADAGVGLPGIPDKLLRVKNGKEGSLLLIDFRDQHHPVLRQWSRQRQEAYLEAGWSVAGVKTQSPLDRFLATRPEVVR